ncbi:squalene/phytoene synthase family protein [Paracoccus sp. Z330]|uniref:Squalene/phytoene synthase family protein n=1 Tax=Paracoccus onchidii TaxID=3017813 RepID=A0ABT4ZHK8_9RHOB|nr:squalene/phytoene synthase family protein [Paracoccus onchidii]MDB6178843.1 squalene/phytoene synthase family protein [Paracoccus onchidii]
MTLEACTELLRQQDPDRFGAVLVADAPQRPALVSLYALNLEVARAPFQSNEPMLAEMRLQWWVDRLTEMRRGIEPPLHDVLSPLWSEWGADAGELAALAQARRRDCQREPFLNPEAVVSYIDATTGALMWFAARRLGAAGAAHRVIADHALGSGIAAWLRALPKLQPLGLGLEAPDAGAVDKLAEIGQEALRRAARGHRAVPVAAAAALYPGPRVPRFLDEVRRGNIDCFVETPAISPFQRRASLARLALTKRWWR